VCSEYSEHYFRDCQRVISKNTYPIAWNYYNLLPRRARQPNPIPLFTLRLRLRFDLNLKVLRILRFWNYTWFQTRVRNIPNTTSANTTA